MQARTTTTQIDGATYQLRKMTPVVGSYIWQRLMAAAFKAARQVGAVGDSAPDEAAQAAPEDRLRGLCAVAFMQLSFEDTGFIQTECMKTISRMEIVGDTESAIPVMMQNGTWAAPEVADNPFLVTKLATEAIAFNLTSFLPASSVAKK